MGNDIGNVQGLILLVLICTAIMAWLISKILNTLAFWKGMRAIEKISDSITELAENKKKSADADKNTSEIK